MKILLLASCCIIYTLSFLPTFAQKNNEAGVKDKGNFINGSLEQMNGNWREAIVEYQRALQKDSNETVFFALAQCYYELGSKDTASMYIDLTLQFNPKNAEAWALLGQISIDRLELRAAIQAYENAVEYKPTVDYRFTLARLYEVGDIPSAIEQYEEILADNEVEEVLQRVTELTFTQKQFDKAKKYAQRLEELEPGSPYVADVLVRIATFQKQWDTLVTLIHKTATMRSNDYTDELFLQIGAWLAMYAEEIVLLPEPVFIAYADAAEKNFATSWKVLGIAGYMCYKIGETDREERLFQQSVRLDTTTEAYSNILSTYVGDQQWKPLIKYAQQAQERFPLNAAFTAYEAAALELAGRYTEAIVAYQRTLALDSTNFTAAVQIGMLYSRLGDETNSELYYGKALQINPQDPYANNNLAYSWCERGYNLDSCLVMVNRSLAKEPEQTSFLDTKGWIYYKMGDFENALRYIQEATEKPGASPAVWEHYGDILLALGKHKEALEAWQYALKLDPDRSSLKQRIQSNSESK